MGTTVKKRTWSEVRDSGCGCGACERRQERVRAQRAAIIRAQEEKFDEAPRAREFFGVELPEITVICANDA